MKIGRKVINMPTPNSIDAHVGFLHLLGSIIKRGGGVLHGCYGHYHFWSEDGAVCTFDAFRLHLKYSTHRCLFLGFYLSCYADCAAFVAKKQR